MGMTQQVGKDIAPASQDEVTTSVRKRRGRTTRNNRWRVARDNFARWALGIIALTIGLLLLALGITLLVRSLPIIRTAGLAALLTNSTWLPHQGQYGFANFIIGTISVTLVAMFFAVVPAVLSGV